MIVIAISLSLFACVAILLGVVSTHEFPITIGEERLIFLERARRVHLSLPTMWVFTFESETIATAESAIVEVI